MARRTAPKRRIVVSGDGGTRRTIKAPSAGVRDELGLDDCPLAVERSSDGRVLIVTLPYEVWIVDAKTLTTQRSIALTMAAPSVVEGWEGTLWIGGQHLHRANIHSTSATKIGTKLGGYVDHLCLVRDDILCGVGATGELLWDIDREGPVHKRKSSASAAIAAVASADGRAVFSTGTETTWVIDPNHTEGYAQLRLAATSPISVESEAIVCLGRSDPSKGGRVLLGAADGALAWTTRDLRLGGERVPVGKRDMTPLALAADERWVYVLRRRGVLHRFLIAQPGSGKKSAGAKGKKARRRGPEASGQQTGELEPPPLPEAQEARLGKLASCMTLLVDGDKRSLVLGGPKADGALGRLWTLDPETLDWDELALTTRTLAEPPPPPDPDAEPPAPQRPSFIATKNKLSGPKISSISVDDIVGAKVDYWLTHGSGSLLDRPIAKLDPDAILPGDALLFPAMVRFAEGTARPALLLWPGVVEDHPGAPPPPTLLVWGDDPRAWLALETPQIRKQKWKRTDVFPIQVALASVPEDLPGKRAKLDPKWIDGEHYKALAKECKKLLKVLW